MVCTNREHGSVPRDDVFGPRERIQFSALNIHFDGSWRDVGNSAIQRDAVNFQVTIADGGPIRTRGAEVHFLVSRTSCLLVSLNSRRHFWRKALDALSKARVVGWVRLESYDSRKAGPGRVKSAPQRISVERTAIDENFLVGQVKEIFWKVDRSRDGVRHRIEIS